MKSSKKSLSLHKRTITMLDDKSLVDLRGGINTTGTIRTCHYQTCRADPTKDEA